MNLQKNRHVIMEKREFLNERDAQKFSKSHH